MRRCKRFGNTSALDLETQANWRDSDAALKEWRKSIESAGVFIFKEAFKQDEISGFCIYDDDFPIIYVNNTMPLTRQIFTLFHELPHLLVRVGGIDKEGDTFLRQLHGDNKRIEVLCNRFAAEFLVPSNDFGRLISGRSIDENLSRLRRGLCFAASEIVVSSVGPSRAGVI